MLPADNLALVVCDGQQFNIYCTRRSLPSIRHYFGASRRNEYFMLLSKSFLNCRLSSIIRLGSTAYSFFMCPLGKYFKCFTPLSLKRSSRTFDGSLRATPNLPQETNM